MVKFRSKIKNSLGIGHKKLGISTEKGKERITKWKSVQNWKVKIIEKSRESTSTGLGTGTGTSWSWRGDKYSRDGGWSTFLHSRQRVFSLRLPSLSRWWLSWLLQRVHLLNHHTLSLPALDLHSLSLLILRYHILRHLLLLTMLYRWIYLFKSTLLALAWRSLLWLVIHVSTPWRIVWINIRLVSLHSLSISSRGLSVLRITWSISMRRWWLICVLCFHLLNFDSLETPLFSFLMLPKGEDILGSWRLDIRDSHMHIFLFGSYILDIDTVDLWYMICLYIWWLTLFLVTTSI